MTGPAHRLALAGLLLAAPLAAAREHRPAPPDAVRWLEPAPGRALVAGERIALAWEPGPRFAELGAVTEWELFVSYDDGETWPVRLTPHLDLVLRRYVARLPPPASDRARFLMRIGDERVEHEVELPAAFAIAPRPAGSAGLEPAALPALGRGESARAGSAGVVLWSERAAGEAEPRWHAAPEVAGGLSPARLAAAPAALLAGVPSRPPPPPAPPDAESRDAFVSAPAAAVVAAVVRAPGVTPLARTCRRNE